MNSNRPLISIIMGIRYTHEDIGLLQRSIQSILSQTYSDFELLVCENESTAAAKLRLKEFAEADDRIVMIDGTGADTLATKLNRCLQRAEGQYVARMDDDDYSYSDRLEKQFTFLNVHPDVAFVGCNVNLRKNGSIIGMWCFPERPTVQDFYMTQPFIHPTLLFHREALNIVKGYSEDKHSILCEDYDLLLRLYAVGYHGANLQETLLDYSLQEYAKGSRKMFHRWNETVIRWRRFHELGVLPKALPYVVKPLVVGLVPGKMLAWIKSFKIQKKTLYR